MLQQPFDHVLGVLLETALLRTNTCSNIAYAVMRGLLPPAKVTVGWL